MGRAGRHGHGRFIGVPVEGWTSQDWRPIDFPISGTIGNSR